jgi:competence protein ComEC
LLLVSPIPILLKWVGAITDYLITQMNGVIERTNRIPFALTKNISIDLSETILLYLLIASLLTWLVQKNTKGFVAALGIIFVWQFIRSHAFF